jgi:hypothetical protein
VPVLKTAAMPMIGVTYKSRVERLTRVSFQVDVELTEQSPPA